MFMSDKLQFVVTDGLEGTDDKLKETLKKYPQVNKERLKCR
jgi:hypothetical protein